MDKPSSDNIIRFGSFSFNKDMDELVTEFEHSASLQSIPQEALGKLAGEFLLRMTDEDLTRVGLRQTPERVAGAYLELLSGYKQSAESAVGRGIFPAEGPGLVSVADIDFFSMCEHHLLPFWGKVAVSYFPGEKILGLSKIPRLVNVYARRVQVQERLTEQIAGAIQRLVKPRAVVVEIRAQHMCMMMRGVKKSTSDTRTATQIGYENLNPWEKDQLRREALRHD